MRLKKKVSVVALWQKKRVEHATNEAKGLKLKETDFMLSLKMKVFLYLNFLIHARIFSVVAINICIMANY